MRGSVTDINIESREIVLGLHYHFVKESDINTKCVVIKPGKKVKVDGPNFAKMHRMLLQSDQHSSLSRDERLNMLKLAIEYHHVNSTKEAAKFLNVAESTVKIYLNDLGMSFEDANK